MLIESVFASFLCNARGHLLTNVNQRFLPAQLIYLSQMTKHNKIISDVMLTDLLEEKKTNLNFLNSHTYACARSGFRRCFSCTAQTKWRMLICDSCYEFIVPFLFLCLWAALLFYGSSYIFRLIPPQETPMCLQETGSSSTSSSPHHQNHQNQNNHTTS